MCHLLIRNATSNLQSENDISYKITRCWLWPGSSCAIPLSCLNKGYPKIDEPLIYVACQEPYTIKHILKNCSNLNTIHLKHYQTIEPNKILVLKKSNDIQKYNSNK